MNELRSKFESKGLSILAVTNGTRAATDRWAERTKCAYPYGYDTTGELSKWFNVRFIPDAVLFDSNGVIVWRGNPGKLREGTIRKALEGALTAPLWEFPDAARDALANRRYAAALRETVGTDFEPLVRTRIAFTLRSVRGALADGDYLRAQELGGPALDGMQGLPEHDELGAELAKLDTPERRAVIASQRELEVLIEGGKTLVAPRPIREMIAKLEALHDAHPDTIVERDARWAIGQLQVRLRAR